MRFPRRRPRLTESEIIEVEAELKAEHARRRRENPELCSACWHPEKRPQGEEGRTPGDHRLRHPSVLLSRCQVVVRLPASGSPVTIWEPTSA